jgi:hypothetical protein
VKTFSLQPDETLKRESDVLALSRPERRPLKGTRWIFLQKRYEKSKKKNIISTGAMIPGAMDTHLDAENEEDLCVLAPPVERDRLTKLFEGRLSFFFCVSLSPWI